MAETLKILGQQMPTSTANVNLYTVPSATSAVISSLVIANVSNGSANARVFVRAAGAAAATSNAIAYDVPIAADSILALTLGITIAATDIITVQSSVASALTFHAFGSEIA